MERLSVRLRDAVRRRRVRAPVRARHGKRARSARDALLAAGIAVARAGAHGDVRGRCACAVRGVAAELHVARGRLRTVSARTGAASASPGTAAPARAGSVDLHSHSTASDGALPPEGVVETAAGAGLAAIALTDHD